MAIKALFIEDDQRYLDFYKETLVGKGLQIFEAREISVAERILADHPDITVVVVDGQLADTDSIRETCEFVKRVRSSGFLGRMIAASSDPKWRRKLVRAGCNHNGGEKEDVPQKLMEVVGL